MEITISKQDLEAAVPAAKEPKGKVFDAITPAINLELSLIEQNILGAAGVAVVEDNTHALYAQAVLLVKRLACTSAFLNEMRSLDLVLTATGFGVVSTQDTAPASKMRVDALEGQLRRQERYAQGDLVQLMFRVSGWSEQSQRETCVPTLFYHISQLQTWANISRPEPRDWDQNRSKVLSADTYLRKHISDAYMDELLSQLTSNSVTAANIPVVSLCQRFIGAWVADDKALGQETYCRLMNRLEGDLTLYPTYADSDAYTTNHLKPYENHAGDTAFHFVG